MEVTLEQLSRTNMQTLTYGVLPNFEAFQASFVDTLEGKELYWLDLPNTGKDVENMFQAGLHADERMTQKWGGDGRTHYGYNAEQLYRLAENLVELHEVDEDEDFANWAGEFASCIMCTLGWEWV